MRILINIAIGFCLTILFFILLAVINSYKLPSFDLNKIDTVNIYEYRSDYRKGNKEISDNQPIYRMVGEEARSFFKEISQNLDHEVESYNELVYSIEIKIENTYYSGKIYPGKGTIEIETLNYYGEFTGKSKKIASSYIHNIEIKLIQN